MPLAGIRRARIDAHATRTDRGNADSASAPVLRPVMDVQDFDGLGLH